MIGVLVKIIIRVIVYVIGHVKLISIYILHALHVKMVYLVN